VCGEGGGREVECRAWGRGAAVVVVGCVREVGSGGSRVGRGAVGSGSRAQGVGCGFRCRVWSVGLGIGGGGRVGAEGRRAVGGGGRRVEGGGRRVDRGRWRVKGEAVGDGRRGWEVGEMRVAVASSAILRCLRRGHVGQ